jgi:hypothetical protein
MLKGPDVSNETRQVGFASRGTSGGAALPWIVAGILLIGMIGTAWWGAGLRTQRDDARTDRDTAQQELLQANSQTNAIAYRLAITPNGPENASGTVFMPLSGSGVLSVVNLPPPASGQTYQFWYFQNDETPPVPGGTFAAGDDGAGFMIIPADVGPFRSIGISVEPEGGSETPTTAMLLQGSLGPARG